MKPRQNLTPVALALAASIAGACAPAHTKDASTQDASTPDASNNDGSLPDASEFDASNGDAQAIGTDVRVLDATAADQGVFDSGADSGADVIAPSTEAGLPSRCTGPFREAERAAVVDVAPFAGVYFYISPSLLADGSLWFSVEEGSNVGRGSYEPRIVEARGWGASPSAAYGTILPRPSVHRAQFARSNTGAPVVGLNLINLWNPQNGARWQLGGALTADTNSFATLPGESWRLRRNPTTAQLFVDRFSPMTAAPAAPPAMLGTVELPAFPSSPGAFAFTWIFRAPNGERTFVAVGHFGELPWVRGFDSALRPVWDARRLPIAQPLSPDSSVIVANSGLWLMDRRSEAGAVVSELHLIDNDGRSRVVRRFSSTSDGGVFLLSASDDLVLLRSGYRTLLLIDPVSGGTIQQFDNALSGSIEGSSLFVIAHPDSSSPLIVLRMRCD